MGPATLSPETGRRRKCLLRPQALSLDSVTATCSCPSRNLLYPSGNWESYMPRGQRPRSPCPVQGTHSLMCLQPAREDSFPELLAACRDCILSDKGLKRNAFALGTALDTQMKHNKVTVLCGSVTKSHSLASTWPRTRAVFPDSAATRSV